MSVTTDLIFDYLHNKYCYVEATGKLWIKISWGKRLSCGLCKKMKKFNLPTLITKYKRAIEDYIKTNRKVQRAFNTPNECRYDSDYEILHTHYIPVRNDKANTVSKLYFFIAQYPRQKITLEYLAILPVIKNKLNFDLLPNSLKTKIKLFL